MIEFKKDEHLKDHAIFFDESDRERLINALFRGTNTLSPPDMELIKLLEDLRK